jgi:aminoglycoside phosphotransferase (APT) family kinase protein
MQGETTMAVLRRRGRRQEEQQAQEHDPASGLDLDAVAEAVRTAAEPTLGIRPELTHGPEPILGYGPDIYRIRLATEDPAWAGTLLARASDAPVLRRESTFVEALRDAGFPAPELVAVPGAEGDGDGDGDGDVLVFRQPPGDSLANVMVANVTSVPQFLAAFGKLHAELHGLPTAGVEAIEAVESDGAGEPGGPAPADPLDELDERAEPDPVREAVESELAWLRAHRPPDGPQVLCHTELSPAYVYLEGTDTASAVPVNWTRARLADPAYDVAATVTAFWSVPIYVDNALQRKALKMARDSLVSAYLGAYRESAPHPLDEGRLDYWQAYHLGWLATEVARRLHGVNGPWEAGTIVAQPESAFDDLRARFHDLAQA